MTRPTTRLTRWLDSELDETLSRVLSSAEPDASVDDAALARMRGQLRDALGPSFETITPPAPPVTNSASLLARGKWLGTGAIVAAGLASFWIARPAPGDVRDVASPLPQEQRAPLGAAEAPAQPRADEPVAPPQPPFAEEPAPARKRVASREASPKRDLGLAEELRQLEQIRRLLASSPERALLAADAQEHRFARGALGPERELLRIDALLRLGRVGEAQRRAERVLGPPENHPYRVQIEKLFARTQRARAPAP